MASLRDSFSAPGVVQAPQPSLLSSFQLALLAVLSCPAPGCAIAYAIEISIERSSPTYPGEESFGTSAATLARARILDFISELNLNLSSLTLTLTSLVSLVSHVLLFTILECYS